MAQRGGVDRMRSERLGRSCEMRFVGWCLEDPELAPFELVCSMRWRISIAPE
jgi:hypothetical protein